MEPAAETWLYILERLPNMFALIKNNKVISFLAEESQKAAFDETHSFIEFSWNRDEPPMISEFSLVDGQLVIPSPTGGNA